MHITFSNYKCFGKSQPITIERPINLVIGKNNSGKSTLMDILEYISTNKQQLNYNRHGVASKVTYQSKIEEKHNSYTRSILDLEPLILGKQTLPVGYDHITEKNNGITTNAYFKSNEANYKKRATGGNSAVLDLQEIINCYSYPYSKKSFIRISSVRNIVPENISNKIDTQQLSIISSDGRGATKVFFRLFNTRDFNNTRKTKYEEFINTLNQIFKGEYYFKEISAVLSESSDSTYEINLDIADESAPVTLSQCGTGVISIILILICTILLPHILEPAEQFVFVFEEVESNLHPAIIRNLAQYLRNFIVEKKHTLFLTTHSNILLDYFSNDEQCTIFNIQESPSGSKVNTLNGFHDYSKLLDGLGFRASDLLQTNCVIWVEGPSDRIYLNRWIELLSDGEIVEGRQYQCLIYGGKLLAHFSADSEDDVKNFIQMLNINRHCIILMDSDKKEESSEINGTKSRVKKEVEKGKGIAWVTHGKEIENYISKEALEVEYSISIHRDINPYEKIGDYLVDVDKPFNAMGHLLNKDGELSDKIEFAKMISKHTTSEFIMNNEQLHKKLVEVISKIKEWNQMGIGK